MKDIAAFIVSLFQDLKLPVKWLAIVVIILAVLFGILGYEKITGHFYLDKLERKMLLLKDLQAIADSGVENNKELWPIYESIVDDVYSYEITHRFIPHLPKLNFGDPVTMGKAFSGAVFWLILVAVGIPTEIKKDGKITGMTIGLAIFLLLIASLFAWLGTIIPTLYSPWINYLLFPAVQFLIIFLITRKKKA
jgi:hypothetical protein